MPYTRFAITAEALLARYFPDVDIILVEGFQQTDLPRIEVHRSGLGSELLSRGKHHHPKLLAVASDKKLPIDVPQLDLHCPATIADFLVQAFALFQIHGQKDHP